MKSRFTRRVKKPTSNEQKDIDRFMWVLASIIWGIVIAIMVIQVCF
jgi:hypothetical protein